MLKVLGVLLWTLVVGAAVGAYIAALPGHEILSISGWTTDCGLYQYVLTRADGTLEVYNSATEATPEAVIAEGEAFFADNPDKAIIAVLPCPVSGSLGI